MYYYHPIADFKSVLLFQLFKVFYNKTSISWSNQFSTLKNMQVKSKL